MRLGENWYVHAPWAQLVCCTEIPEDKLIKFMAVSNEVLDEAEASDDNFGDGVIPVPWTISDEKFVKYDVVNFNLFSALTLPKYLMFEFAQLLIHNSCRDGAL